ncbi:MAG: HAD family hydrolase [Candidatus Latescibacterota bacterium]
MLLCCDFDGVFVDSLDYLVVRFNAARRAVGAGRACAPEDLRTIESFSFEDVGRRLGVPEERIARFSRQVFEHLRRDGARGGLPEVFAGVPQVVAALARDHLLAIVTAAEQTWVERVLERHGMRGAVSGILDGEAPGTKAEKIAALCRTFAHEPRQTLMVGDALSDLRQGRRAGVRTVAITWGFQPRHLLLAEHPDFVADRPDDLLAIATQAARGAVG